MVLRYPECHRHVFTPVVQPGSGDCEQQQMQSSHSQNFHARRSNMRWGVELIIWCGKRKGVSYRTMTTEVGQSNEVVASLKALVACASGTLLKETWSISHSDLCMKATTVLILGASAVWRALKPHRLRSAGPVLSCRICRSSFVVMHAGGPAVSCRLIGQRQSERKGRENKAGPQTRRVRKYLHRWKSTLCVVYVV